MIDDEEAFEERSAIREFDGGFSREKAERLAKKDMENARSLNKANPRPEMKKPDFSRSQAHDQI